MTYQTSHGYGSISDYGKNLLNSVAYESGNNKIGEGRPDDGGDITDKDISALKTYESICVKISATEDTTEGAVSGVGNESVTLYAK